MIFKFLIQQFFEPTIKQKDFQYEHNLKEHFI